MKSLLESEPQLLQYQDQDGNLPLHAISVKYDAKQLDLLKLIAGGYPEGCKIRNKKKQLPIHLLTNYPAKLFLAEIWPESLGEADFNGAVPFHCFLGAYKRSDLLDKALELYPPGAKTPERGILPIHYAAINGYIDRFKSLARVYPDGLRTLDSGGNLPFHYIASHGRVDQLLCLFGPNANLLKHPNKEQQLPIHVAAKHGRIQNAHAIYELCPESLEAVDCEGNTPLHYLAEKCPYTELFRKLVGKYPAAIKCKNKQGRLPIDMVTPSDTSASGIAAMCTKVHALGKLYPDSILCRTNLDPFFNLLESKLPKCIHSEVRELYRFRDSVQKNKYEATLSKAREDLILARSEAAELKRKLDAVDQERLEANDVVEQTLLSNLIANKGASCSLDDLKTVAKSLQARLPRHQPHSMWQMLLPSLLRDEHAERGTLVQVIEVLNNEVHDTEPTVATTPLEGAAGRNKRPRVSISPSS